MKTALLLTLLALSPSSAIALAGTPGQTTPAAATQQIERPATIEDAIGVKPDRLRARAAELSPDELSGALAEWMALIEDRQAAFEMALGAEKGSDERASMVRVGSDIDALIACAEVLIETLAQSGGDVESARATIADIRAMRVEQLDQLSTVPADLSTASKLKIESLEARLRPLTKTQVEEQLVQWTAVLQQKCIEVGLVEIDALESSGASEVDRQNQRGVVLRAERASLIDRVNVVIDALESKGGDVTEPRAYVSSVVVTPPITGLRAAWSTIKAWMINPDGGLSLAWSVGLAILIFVAAFILSRILSRIVDRALSKVKKTSSLLNEFAVGSVRKATVLLGFLLALNTLGVNLGPLLAAIGAAGLVIGFALQGTLSNFASGLMIMVYRPFDVGDLVSTAGTLGRIEGLTLVTTTIKTLDNQTIYIPNNMVWGDVITNVTANATRRVDMVFGIGYGDDVDKAAAVLKEVLAADENILAEPESTVELHELGDSSVNFVVRPWVKTENYWRVYWDLTRAVKKRFDEEGISIPFPQRDVHVHQVPSAAPEEFADRLIPAGKKPADGSDAALSPAAGKKSD